MATDAKQPTKRVRFTTTTTETTGLPNPPVYPAGKSFDFPDSTAEYWISRGVAVLDEGSKPEPKPKTLADMNLDELRAYARDNGIDLKAAKTKTEIVSAINAVAESRKAQNETKSPGA